MTPRAKVYPDGTARAAAHRERQKQGGMCRLELMLDKGTADKLRAIAKTNAVTPSEMVTRLLAEIPETK